MENFIFCAVAPATSINDSSIFYLKSIVEYFETYNYLVLFAFMCYLSVEKHESIIFGDLIFGSPKILSYHFSGVFLIPFFRHFKHSIPVASNSTKEKNKNRI